MASLAVFGILAACLTAADASKASTPPQVSPIDLINAYQTNRAYFDENYAKKPVEVTGRVDKVLATGGTPPNASNSGVAFAYSALQYEVRMNVDKSVVEFTFGEEARSQLAKLKLPQEVRIQGICLGGEERKDGFRVYFKGCKVTRSAKAKSEREASPRAVLGASLGR